MTLEEAIKELKSYVLSDTQYMTYINSNESDSKYTDFDMFCIRHCESIDVVLDYILSNGIK